MATKRIRPLRIGAVVLPTPLALAPMAGITHSAFRRLILSIGGCGLVVTEMINADTFCPQALRSHRMLHFHPTEHPIAVQIAGHDPEGVAQAVAIAQAHGADIADINAGCPVPKVTRRGAGAALLRNLDRLEAILRRARQSSSIPLTLKFRSGWNDRSIVATEVARLAEDCGCAAMTLHPRTRTQRHGGKADWRIVRDVVDAVSIPVFASGDIRSVEDARHCFEQTGCAGLMVARESVNNPWMFAQIAAALSGEEPFQPTPADRYRLLQRYCEFLRQDTADERRALKRFKRLLGKIHPGFPEKAAFRRWVMRGTNLEATWQLVEAYYAHTLANPLGSVRGGES